MSTRANIIVKDGSGSLIFYRHSDGYPEGTLPTLSIFMKWLKEGKIRKDLQQGSGWLILLGAMEYDTVPKFEIETSQYGTTYGDVETIKEPKDWKCGSYEPTTCIHGDIEYLYTIDLEKETLTYGNYNRRTEKLTNVKTFKPEPQVN